MRIIGVVGLGTMGAGIVEVFARAGFSVIAVEVTEQTLTNGRGHVEHSTERALQRGKLSHEEREKLFQRITFTTSLAQLVEADLVVEAVPERMELKAAVFAELDQICPAKTVFASNTSSLSITELSVHTSRPSKVVGMHFFNPAPVLKLVEVVRTVVTEPEVVTNITELAHRLGKVPVVIGDRAGFIANALLFGYLNHAVRMYESRYASREDIDTAMRLGCGYPMGPLALLDLIGLDTAYEILDTMYHQSRNRLHAPAPLLKQMITAGMLGRKVGRGFYTYAEPDSPRIVDEAERSFSEVENLQIQQIAVIGAGAMGVGIAEVCAKAGYSVLLCIRNTCKSASTMAAIQESIHKAIAKEKITEHEAHSALQRIQITTDLAQVAIADLIIEAISEDLTSKKILFTELDNVAQPTAILATTTSSLPVIELAASTSRASQVVGLHFFNPAPVMKLVEVVHTIATAPEVIATAQTLCVALDKHPVTCGDRSGFIVNALLFPYLNDAIKMLEAHYASVDDIDNAMKIGCGLPMGPFQLLDVIGLDVALAIQRELYLEFREAGFAPAPLLEQLVTAGRLGRKTGKGFHDCTT